MPTNTPRNKKREVQPLAENRGVTIRGLGGVSIPVIDTGDLKRKAMQWAYVVRSRVRWATDHEAFETVRQKVITDLDSFGLTETRLKQLGEARIIEVDIPFTTEDNGWEFRVLPWEFLLSAGTGCPIVVVRRLDCLRPVSYRAPRSVGIAASLPGRLKRSGYEFDSEIALVRSNLPFDTKLWQDPTLETLKDSIAKSKPDVIHLAGVDLHEGLGILHQKETPEERTLDGYYLAGDRQAAAPIYSQQLAQALTVSGKHHPVLVSCNIYNSAARTAALVVAGGACSAIGFQDEIDDIVAEEFFTTFYREWRQSNWNLLSAFESALRKLSTDDKTGSGVVLWSALPLVDTARAPSKAPPAASKAQSRKLDLTVDLIPTVEPVEAVNYSLLHNEQSLFSRFTLTNAHPTENITGIRLYVELCVGDQTYPFRTLLNLAPGSIENLTERVRIPLTSTLFRSLREGVRSVLFVRISVGDHDLTEQTYPVRLLAIDEWLDTEKLNAFLPSFVLSRDSAVLRIVDSAQRHLMTLADDPGAGFDGYQSVDPQAENPSEAVDRQAWAIWSALSYDFSIGYINPPPSFEESSQRLRSPSDVIEGRRGTCIDLALLLAACLEYVGIYPVIFLLNDHAFPGYWRSEQSREKFFAVRAHPDAQAERKQTSPYAWVELKEGYGEVIELVRCGDLSPLEAVWLTQNKGFWEARDAGVENLRSRDQFESMIDVQRARDKKVTPLPLVSAV